MLLSSYVFELHAINGVYGVWYSDDIEIDACALSDSHIFFRYFRSVLYALMLSYSRVRVFFRVHLNFSIFDFALLF